MPTIETYSARNNQRQVQASASDFVDTSGQRAMADSLGDVSDVLFKVQVQKDTLDYTKRASELQIQLMQDAESINNNDLPEGETITSLYQKTFDARVKDFNIPRTIKGKVQSDIEAMRLNFSSRGVQEESRQAGIKAKSDWEQSLINAKNIVMMNPSMADAMDEQLKFASASLNLPDAERDALYIESKRELDGAQAEHYASNNPSAFLAQAKAGKWNNLENLGGYIRAAESKIKQSQAIAKNNIIEEWNVLESAINGGFDVSKSEVESIAQRAQSLGLGKQSEMMVAYKENYDTIKDFVLNKTSSEQTDMLVSMREKINSGDRKDIPLMSALNKAYKQKAEAIQSGKGWEYYENQKIIGKITPITPQTMQDPDTISVELSNRKAYASIVEARDGVKLPIWTAEEAKQLAETMDSANFKEASTFMNSLKSSLNDDDKGALAVALYDYNSVLSLAMVQDDSVAKAIISGNLIKDSAVSKSKFADYLSSKVKNLIYDPVVYNSTLDGAFALYKQTALNEGVLDKETVDPNIMKKLIPQLFGNIESVSLPSGNASIILPKDINPTSFGLGLRALTDEKLKEIGYSQVVSMDGKVTSIERIMNFARPVSSGPKSFGFVIDGLGIGGAGKVMAVNNDGDLVDLIIDVDQIDLVKPTYRLD